MIKDRPPQFALRFFRWFCHPKLLKYIEGDLMELYDERVREKGKQKANAKFIIDVLLLFRPGVIRSVSFNQNRLTQGVMFRNNLRIAVRSLWKNKASSFINVLGLTVGLSACLLIALFIKYEAGFDAFQFNGHRIARVIMDYSFDGSPESKRGNYTSTKVAPVFARTFPEVELSVRMFDPSMIVLHQNVPVLESSFVFADSSFLNVFTTKWLEGNKSKALDGPYKVVLSQSTARKYFNEENPIGKIILTGADQKPYEVTGVVEDYPNDSQIKFDFLASFSSLGENQEETYWGADFTTYLLLKDERSIYTLQPKVDAFMKKEMAGSGARIDFILERFDQIHLHSPYAAFVPNTNIDYLYILSAVALLILVIVCFTYINLSTARSFERAKEVGVRKVIGAARTQLFWQFIGESWIVCMVSIVFSIALVLFALPYFNQLIGKELQLRLLFSPSFISFSIGVTVVVSLLAGSYPAMVLTGFQPATVLKGVFRNSASGKRMQQFLIVFQFSVSVLLIISTLIVQKQLYFIQNAKLGYNRHEVMVMPLRLPLETRLQKLEQVKRELTFNPHVISVSSANSTPVQMASGYTMRSATMSEKEQISVTASPIDQDFVKTTGLQIIAGENLSEQDMKDVVVDDFSKATYHFLLNEQAAKQLGWTPEEAVGKKFFMGERIGFVEGVIKDFHFQSMHQTIKPLVLFSELRSHGQLLVKISGQNIPETISFMEKQWKQFAPEMPFEYRFLDEDYSRLYRSELQLGILMNLFSGIAIVLACLGLFGLSSYVAHQRMKEIGIRKILGASVFSIFSLLSGKFSRFVILSILIASPAGYWIMNRWLQDFAYQIEMPWWIFITGGLGVILIALITVSVQSIKAAVANPVKSLRSE
jgi:putative ABC transport system permease protein